ncbi:MAG: YlxR family protein [Fimbriimonadia bacterium]
MGNGRSHVPIRTCVGCARKAAKGDLVRLALDPDGRLLRDQRNRLPGRGAYVCGAACARVAAKYGRFERAYRRSVAKNAIEECLATWENEVSIGGNETETE